ncbi:MAG: methylenetetrahydrofolate--tRNA-(uracil(54)-C(5))-methyltransferase (FADH(2)-oxidizing) TrmFO [Deltaproteobacteria bacterium]|nr:methylenetetrahydrofolate--tRNA-(uracil(54)-C(5))-methyltransferase (FADH(2)-oxidizing) TrmFO [Deltaproteobacteria bacterium]
MDADGAARAGHIGGGDRPRATVIGGGLAGCEAAARLSSRGVQVRLMEMKPRVYSPAHASPGLAELVCSNSLRSDSPDSAVGLLKEEARLLGSLVMEAADKTRVPAGRALAVDRTAFSAHVTEKIKGDPGIELVLGEEVADLAPFVSSGEVVVVAAGPLAGAGLAASLARLAGADNLHFYDALAPIVTADSLDMDVVFRADRYGEEGSGDYLNCPLDERQYEDFVKALLEADKVAARDFEEASFFEGCLPVEVMAQRNPRTLAFGPMKPVGLRDPRGGGKLAAAVQLRAENEAGTHYNMVGFQTRLTVPGQEAVFRMIPGLAKAVFARFGAVHRNTHLDAPRVLDEWQRLLPAPRVFLAGQISGVEGYVESAAQGLLAGENAARTALGLDLLIPPPESALGSLVRYLRTGPPGRPFEPSNVNFGLFPPPPESTPKRQRAALRLERARQSFQAFLTEVGHVRRS